MLHCRPFWLGESWLLSILLKMAKTRVPVNKGQEPCTTKVYAERCHFEGMQNAIILSQACRQTAPQVSTHLYYLPDASVDCRTEGPYTLSGG
ncbi:hypothetical protein EDD15DRAFT_723656 [Pisolithus albus]|nr:hypothetical protein EDD15DRAFT_723656 [Pisolithus albus]